MNLSKLLFVILDYLACNIPPPTLKIAPPELGCALDRSNLL